MRTLLRTAAWTPLALATSLALMAGTAQADPHWHGDIHHFEYRDMHYWHGGLWRHEFHDGRLGWWWVVGGVWYFYPQPVYPYPDPYTPPVVVQQQPTTVIVAPQPTAPVVVAPQQPAPVVVAPQPVPAPAPAPAAAPAPQSWYYCEASRAYYPYVSSCAAGWKQVPATPPAGAPR